jgi:hypothetical protein
MRWQPGAKLKLALIVCQAGIERDFVKVPLSKRHEGPGITAKPHPGDSIREVIVKHPNGLAYFNAGEMGFFNFPIIADGNFVAKPEPAKAVLQKQWLPLAGEFSFFVQYPDGQVKIQDLPIKANQLVPGWPKGTWAFSAPYVMKGGEPISFKNPPPGHSPGSQEVLFPGGDTRAPVSALGIARDGKAVRISLVGDGHKPQAIDRLPTEIDLTHYLQKFEVVDALYTGASGDVQYFDRQTQTLGIGPERPKSADSQWLLREGQTERGLTVVGMLTAVFET